MSIEDGVVLLPLTFVKAGWLTELLLFSRLSASESPPEACEEAPSAMLLVLLAQKENAPLVAP